MTDDACSDVGAARPTSRQSTANLEGPPPADSRGPLLTCGPVVVAHVPERCAVAPAKLAKGYTSLAHGFPEPAVHLPVMSRAQLLALPFGPLHVREALRGQGRFELRFAGHHNVHMGLTPLERAAYFSEKLPDCDLRLNKFYVLNLKYLYYRSDAQLAVLMRNLRRHNRRIVYGNVASRENPYSFRLMASSVRIKGYRADLGLILMAGLADASSLFALLLLHAPPDAPEKILFEFSRMEPFFTPRCLHAAVRLLAGYAVMPARDLGASHHRNSGHYLKQAGSVVAAYLWSSRGDTTHELQKAVDSMNIESTHRTFLGPAMNSGYAGAVQGCILGGVLKYARRGGHGREEKRARVRLLIQFALGGAMGVPVWGFTFMMAASVVDMLTDRIVGTCDAGEIVSIVRQQRACAIYADAYRSDGFVDEDSLDRMMIIALVEAARPD